MKKYIINSHGRVVTTKHKNVFSHHTSRITHLASHINFIIILLIMLIFIMNGCGDSGITLIFMPSPTPVTAQEIYNETELMTDNTEMIYKQKKQSHNSQ